jgi:hypothetical protein
VSDRGFTLGSLRALHGRVVASTRTGRLSASRRFVDAWRSEQRASIVLGSARSGTTKLAELLSSARGVRLLLEPLHTFRSPLVPPTFVWGEYLDPGARQDDLRALWSECLAGRARGNWIDQFNQARIVRHRVVKDIAATNLTAWLRTEFPHVGLVYVVRHPFAVATSVTALRKGERDHGHRADWDHQDGVVVDQLVQRSGLLDGPLAQHGDAVRAAWRAAEHPFDRGVLRWCLENAFTLTTPPPGVRVVFFEQLVRHPATELASLGNHLGIELDRKVMDLIERPSRTDYRRVAQVDLSVEARIGDWTRGLEPERKRAGLGVVEMFGLDRFYGEGPLPLRTAIPRAQIPTVSTTVPPLDN